MEGYRVDRRDFNVGDIIRSAREYADNLDTEREKVETFLSRHRFGGKPDRTDALHIFGTEDSARKHWHKTHNGKLYLVSFPKILHRGDMGLTEMIYKAIQGRLDPDHLALSYWRSEEAQGSDIELLVDEAKVVEVLSKDEAERRRDYVSRTNMLPLRPGAA